MERRFNIGELAWAAGFFDGEGSVFAEAVSRRPGHMRIRANVGQQPSGDEDSAELQRFRRAVLGLGRIGPPYLDKRYATSYQQWRALSFEECQAVVAMLWRWLGSVKREEARAALRPYLSQFAWRKTRRPRARPYADWALSAFNTGSLESELAWAAGLFDGEGWVGVRERRAPGARCSGTFACT